MVYAGNNSLQMSCGETGHYIVGVQMMKRRAQKDVYRAMKPKETLDEAVQRVCNIIKGPDADDELMALSTTLSLRCPLTGGRITKPARFTNIRGLQVRWCKDCIGSPHHAPLLAPHDVEHCHIVQQAFDLDAFLSTVQRSRKWVDPLSDQGGSISDLQVSFVHERICMHVDVRDHSRVIDNARRTYLFFTQEDVYLERVLEALARHPNVEEVEISPDGLWRPCGMSTQEWLDVRNNNNDARLPDRAHGAANAIQRMWDRAGVYTICLSSNRFHAPLLPAFWLQSQLTWMMTRMTYA